MYGIADNQTVLYVYKPRITILQPGRLENIFGIVTQ